MNHSHDAQAHPASGVRPGPTLTAILVSTVSTAWLVFRSLLPRRLQAALLGKAPPQQSRAQAFPAADVDIAPRKPRRHPRTSKRQGSRRTP